VLLPCDAWAAPYLNLHNFSFDLATNISKFSVSEIFTVLVMDTNQVYTFNKLPRKRLTPSGAVPNHWHFSVCHVPISPPGDVLFLLNPAARFVHVAGRLPSASDTETSKLRVVILAISLLMAFNRDMGNAPQTEMPPTGRPWSWATNDAQLAGAVGEALSSMGVEGPLVHVQVSGVEENGIADEEWRNFLRTLEQTVARHKN